MTALVKELLLASSGYWVLNKTLVKELGLETAFLLSNLAEAEQMLADENGWFYQTIKTVEEVTTLKRHKQERCIQELEDVGILEVDKRGLPPKRYFRLNYERIAEIIEISTSKQIAENQQIVVQKPDITLGRESASNKEHINKENNIKEHTKGVSKKSKDNNTIPKEVLETIITRWNDVAKQYNIPQVKVINKDTARYRSLNARYKEYGLETLLEGIDSIHRSKFLQGSNGWCITFDWYISKSNIIKVLEGNYEDRRPTNSGTLNNPNYRVSTLEDKARDEDGNLLEF